MKPTDSPADHDRRVMREAAEEARQGLRRVRGEDMPAPAVDRPANPIDSTTTGMAHSPNIQDGDYEWPELAALDAPTKPDDFIDVKGVESYV